MDMVTGLMELLFSLGIENEHLIHTGAESRVKKGFTR